MIKKLLKYLYWKYVWEFSFVWKINGKWIAIGIERNIIKRYFLQAKGKIENFQKQDSCFTKEEFASLVSQIERELVTYSINK